MKVVMVKALQCYSASPSMLFGLSPKVTMICGNCSHAFSKRFKMIELYYDNPKTRCPDCNTLNVVPISSEP